jgi:hypothetical protein
MSASLMQTSLGQIRGVAPVEQEYSKGGVELEYEVTSVSAMIPVARLSVKPMEFTQSPETKVVLLLSAS